MIVEIKLYTLVKPKIRYIECESVDDKVLLLVSDDVKYFNSDSDFYSIQMNNVRCIPFHPNNANYFEEIGMVAPEDDDLLSNETVDPNTINFDGPFKVCFTDENGFKFKCLKNGDISAILILPTNNDLDFSIKTIANENISPSIYFHAKPSDYKNIIKPQMEDPYYTMLVNIEEKLDYIINKIGG